MFLVNEMVSEVRQCTEIKPNAFRSNGNHNKKADQSTDTPLREVSGILYSLRENRVFCACHFA